MHAEPALGLIVDHTRAFAQGTQTALELVDACLGRIEVQNPRLNALIHVDQAHAFNAAAESTDRWRRLQPLSPIDGLPIAIKSNMAMAGAPWTAGMGVYLDRIAKRDARCVARLKAAGAIVIGIANMDEAAMGASGDNLWHGRIEHPTDSGLSPGGSSGGSAVAVAAGFCVAALGTDTMGSVRIPAAYCGLVGYKPSHGLIDTDGVTPLAPSFDTVGVLATSVDDCQTVVAALTDQPLGEASSHSIRLAVPERMGSIDLEPDIVKAFEGWMGRAAAGGIRIERIEWPDLARLQRLLLMATEIEAATVHRQTMVSRPHDFSPGLLRLLNWGAAQPSTRLDAIRLEMATLLAPAQAALQTFDAVVSPTMTHRAFRLSEPSRPDQAAFTSVASALGCAAICMPVTRTSASLQIMARDDAVALTVARLMQTF